MEVLRLYSEMLCSKDTDSLIKRFAKTVTNKWLLYLLSETSPEVVVLSVRILARLLVVHGDSYVKKFKERTGGFAIMAHRLKRWWHLPALWPCSFAILFDIDVATLDLDRPFDLFSFVELFSGKKELVVAHPEMVEVIMSMLQSGMKAIVSSHQHSQPGLAVPLDSSSGASTPQRLSMSTMAPPNPLLTIVTLQHVETFNTVLRFLSDLHTRSSKFREFAATSLYVQGLLSVLFPVVVGSDIVDASTELDARDSTLTFDGSDVVVQPLSSSPPIIRASNVDESQLTSSRGKTLRRGSSFVLVTKDKSHANGSQSNLRQFITPASPAQPLPQLNEGNAIVQSLLEIVVSVFIDQIVMKKDFPGLGLFLRTPPGFVEHQSYFESWILRNTVSQLSTHFALNQKLLPEPKVLTNLARLFSHLGEALFEGWFVGGAESVLDLSGSILEYLQRPDIAGMKSVRLCAQAIGVIRAVVFRTVLLTLSQLQNAESLAFLEKLSYWQNVLLSTEETQSLHLQLICYLLYASLVSEQQGVRNAAANLWRIILVQKPTEAAAILGQADTAQQKRLASSFEKLVELDNETFLYWIDEHREELDSLFFETLSRTWERFVAEENKRTEENARGRIARRREKLKTWARDESDRAALIRRHEVTFDHWTSNIFSSEHLKHQRLLQDQQDDLLFAETAYAKMERDTTGHAGVFAKPKQRKWRLDQTEGRNRMRMRLHEDYEKTENEWQPKRKGTDTPALQLDTRNVKIGGAEVAATPIGPSATDSPKDPSNGSEPFPEVPQNEDDGNAGDVDESFELIEDPNAEIEDNEDKNRKVMRSLHRGDQVKHVANISRILGLEAVEGLLILGKDHVYLMDNFFQRADGEIVNVSQAPQEERDFYIREISGRDVKVNKATARDNEHEVRSWKWSEVISVSKRRFLFRDVAIEMFFGDGRSYLLTVISPTARNDLHGLISARAPQFGAPDSPQSEFAWRYETLKSVEDEPQGFGSRFANVFSNSSAMAATKKWQKGELSNFHYLMLVNTLAGRTYNDLTQYPVFPWVISDYTSEELDLNDPKSFRDLSKPMGCQTPEREAEFRDRYKSFAEMNDSDPPFHYGTHYSTAMIVTSYLIRLQPFVKSYLLLQGGSFDHPDRLFFSIEGAWRSAARMNMTDVRELTPEFFYLPEFLVNLNGFDFGKRQNSSKSIGEVELPPWAKGDPKIFIAKNREALESPYVSKNLHHWIDLVFGSKQKGDAAIEAVNVFHHLSYQGAKDLDAIADQRERLATIGIIHNFGQTPYQVFHRPHPAREQNRHKYKRLDTAAESLTRLPEPLLDTGERVASLTHSWKNNHGQLLCSGPFRINMPPHFEYYMEWGFTDNSVRFYNKDRKQVGLFEHLHIGQLSCAIFADSKTLITAGVDCTIAVWTLHFSGKHVELQPKAPLFGHKKPPNVMAMSRSFNALFTTSAAGELMLWDLNRCEFVRKIDRVLGAEVQCACVNDVTGNVILCAGSQISVYTINGDLEWLERDIIFTGHKWGVVRVWSLVISQEGKFELELIRQLNHVDTGRGDGGNVAGSVTCILPKPQVVYTGWRMEECMNGTVSNETRLAKMGFSDICIAIGSQASELASLLLPHSSLNNSIDTLSILQSAPYYSIKQVADTYTVLLCNGKEPLFLLKLSLDSRLPQGSVFPSTYRSDATSEEVTKTKVEGEISKQDLEGRGGRVTKEQVDINIKDDRYRDRDDFRVYEKTDRVVRDDRHPAGYYKDTKVDIEVDAVKKSTTKKRATNPTYDVEYERRRPAGQTTTEVHHHRDMGYYDDEGHYHSFRRGVERAADKILHPFSHRDHHHHHHHDNVVVDERREEVDVEVSSPSRVRDGNREQIRYSSRPSRGPSTSGMSRFDTVTIPCHFIRIGDLIILQGRPCEVIKISLSNNTGQYRFLGVDLFTKKLQEESSFNTNPEPSVYVQSMLGPVFRQYRILDIREDGLLVCMTESGDVKQGIPVIDNNGLWSKIQREFEGGRGSIRALVINDGGRELVVDYKVIHGSRL
ncbi:Beige-like protein [Cyphellophora attinorum]|uniref:Beige-like protein n=1 Tax=Cyphellophora attinorum TaxID=1664694 RepID=A0A0N0NNH1_9EURO|nr:Beige-like protein [Phialophora attinorum]KPI41369.1 Beige-like protein [Phialophora attinorum]